MEREAEAEEDTPSPAPETEEEEEAPSPQRRSICSKCHRPTRVCLCHVLPLDPIPTTTRVLILQHPHEARHKLSTTPLLTRSLLHASALTARRLRPGLSPLLDAAPPALYLFPAAPATHISALRPSELPPGLLLIAFDATWSHAREMVKASEGFLSTFATRVSLAVDESVSGGTIYDSDLILRKEPYAGCVSTMEAVARALRVLEPNGLHVEERLIGILREMVRLQAGFLKPVKPRPKLLKHKKKVEGKEKTEGSNQG
ncbi:DTW domain-containing protein 2 isoform X2 [Cajanus cajan]|uniref:tRNA-uridine aminocarboxypropyltransferase n=1 Tax=Cajanus cajan TaxID=3821 RepID=A0A151TTY0_CAJCA|nr:DTW domain-containing protein 2 isoform X2 [Cajanus cajan]KYP70513.1 DTW domain-containing protein 2 [Cajanus cajan]